MTSSLPGSSSSYGGHHQAGVDDSTFSVGIQRRRVAESCRGGPRARGSGAARRQRVTSEDIERVVEGVARPRRSRKGVIDGKGRCQVEGAVVDDLVQADFAEIDLIGEGHTGG